MLDSRADILVYGMGERQIVEIARRLDAVEQFVRRPLEANALRESLSGVYDVERLLSRIAYDALNARDCLALKASLQMVPLLKRDAAAYGAVLIREASDALDPMEDVASLLSRAIADDPPLSVRDGGIIRAADGVPAGTFHEGAADVFSEVRPEISEDLRYRGLLRAQDALLALGVTGWQDAVVGAEAVGIADPMAAYERAIKALVDQKIISKAPEGAYTTVITDALK